MLQDRALAFFFLFCLWGNVSVDIFMGLDVDLRSTGFAFHRIVYESGVKFDPLFVENSQYMRYSALITAIIYAPYYVIATISLLKGDGLGKRSSFVRNYSWVYAVGMFVNMSIVLSLEYNEFRLGSKLAPKLGFYWIPCGSYWLIPFLLIFRLQRESRRILKDE